MHWKRMMLIFAHVVLGAEGMALGASYHVDAELGDDGNDGLSPQTAWVSLEKASRSPYKAGDRILLKRGATFRGKLHLKEVEGQDGAPVVVEAYGEGNVPPIIDGAGYTGGVVIEDSVHVQVRNLEITNDGGIAIDPKAKTERFGVHVLKSSQVAVEGMRLHTIFATIATKSEGKTGMTAYGHGVRMDDSQHIRVSNCVIEKVGRYGINGLRSSHIEVFDNTTDHTGCSGIQFSRCKQVVVRNNVIDHPGSFVDPRMHGRGSGSWVWGCEDVLYEKNIFLNARGKADSHGVHIDFNCRNVVIQYCFSMNNEGGFIEILGNNYNCAYRYNISVNDGFRKKGQDGAIQEGKVFWLDGFVGNAPRSGPFNSYIYNNTIYVREGIPPRFSISPSTRGALVANNIFHLLGKGTAVAGDQREYKDGEIEARGVVFANNVYLHEAVLPANLKIKDDKAIFGDAQFKNPGGATPEDYVPTNRELIKDRGIRVAPIPGDDIGLAIGLDVATDYFGQPILGAPDIGAIEMQD